METARISRKFIGGARLWRVNRGDWEKNHGFLLGSRTSFRDSDDDCDDCVNLARVNERDICFKLFALRWRRCCFIRVRES